MSKLIIHQERSINRSSWKPKRKWTSSKEYIGSFKKNEKKRKEEKNEWKITKKKEKKKKKIYSQKFIKEKVQ